MSVDYYPRRSEMKGRYLADDGAQMQFRVRVPASTTRDALIEEVLGYGVAMIVHD